MSIATRKDRSHITKNSFNIINSVNASIGFSNLQIGLSRALWLIPPIVSRTIALPVSNNMDALCVQNLYYCTISTVGSQGVTCDACECCESKFTSQIWCDGTQNKFIFVPK